MADARSDSLPRWLAALVIVCIAVNVGLVVINLGSQHEVRSAHTARTVMSDLREQGVSDEGIRRAVRAIAEGGDRAASVQRQLLVAAVLSSIGLVLLWETASRRLRRSPATDKSVDSPE